MLNNRGFTLVEAIISIAILGIIAVTFIPMFSNQHVSIIGTGEKSKATYLAVEEVEKAIKGEGLYSEEDEELSIEFRSSSEDIKIKIKNILVEKEYKKDKKKIKIRVGIPNFKDEGGL